MNKKTVFKIISIALPFILILCVEMVLRLVGYGDNYQLFNKVKIENKPEYLIMNSDVSKKYFKDTGFHSDNQSDLFLRTKTDSTYRIFVQGASTVVGFPFYHGGSFPRMLKQRLSETFPEKNIEVINTGITAVNSYTLWDLTDKIIEQKPDLVIFYAGHNEYYGALGVGSSSSFGSHPSVVRSYLFLKNFRFFQWLDNTYTKLFNRKKEGLSIAETTLMEVMAKEQRIPLNSEVYQAGIDQFEGNLDKILKTYNKNNIPVIISTIVSNEKDIKPFISDYIKDNIKFTKDLNEGNLEANKLAQNNAMAAYKLGRYYLEKNQDTAKKYLHLAKELDLLRFRAPEKINEVITNLAQKYNCPLIDIKAAFLEHSTEEIIGNELLTEHLHPNIKGYFIIADAFYNKIKELKYIGDWDNYITYDEAFEFIPITQIDSLRGKFLVEDLKNSWPYDLGMSKNRPMSSYNFIQNPTYEERRAIEIHSNQVVDWRDVMHQSYYRYNREKAFKKGLQVAQSLIFEFPEEGEGYRLAGQMCLKLERLDKAAYYFFKCNELDKSSKSAQNLASTYLKLNKIDLANKALIQAKKRGLNEQDLNNMLRHITKKANGLND